MTAADKRAPGELDKKNYFTGGSFGIDISPDGGTLGISFNGKQLDQTRSAQSLNHFEQCSVMLLEIPASER